MQVRRVRLAADEERDRTVATSALAGRVCSQRRDQACSAGDKETAVPGRTPDDQARARRGVCSHPGRVAVRWVLPIGVRELPENPARLDGLLRHPALLTHCGVQDPGYFGTLLRRNAREEELEGLVRQNTAYVGLYLERVVYEVGARVTGGVGRLNRSAGAVAIDRRRNDEIVEPRARGRIEAIHPGSYLRHDHRVAGSRR